MKRVKKFICPCVPPHLLNSKRERERIKCKDPDECEMALEQTILDLKDLEIDGDKPQQREVAKYCLSLIHIMFHGQTCGNGDHDEASTQSTSDHLNLGVQLRKIHEFLNKQDTVNKFTGKEKEYLEWLKMAAKKRRKNEKEADEYFEKLKSDTKRFIKIYRQRGMKSQDLETESYWGTRQQLMAGKVIADWLDKDGGPLDPLFGVLFNPTAGRVGAGDSGIMHEILFDDDGYMAYHSATHDAFGYLRKYHDIGPGYDYMDDSILSTDNPMSGQIGGMNFWKKVVDEVQKKQQVIHYMQL